MGVSELAAVLGVSRQRASQIARDYDDFPEPAVRLATGPVWESAEIAAWRAKHPVRRPGPRPKATERPE